MAKEEELFHLVPLKIHRRNAAERHIQMWKNHLISVILSFPKGSLLNFWCYLIPQECLTLNLMQKYHINPKFLAQAQLHSMFDFNATPLSPQVTKCILHGKQGQEEVLQLGP